MPRLEEQADESTLKEDVRNALASSTARERRVIELRFVLCDAHSRDVRDCAKVARLAASHEDIDELVRLMWPTT